MLRGLRTSGILLLPRSFLSLSLVCLTQPPSCPFAKNIGHKIKKRDKKTKKVVRIDPSSMEDGIPPHRAPHKKRAPPVWALGDVGGRGYGTREEEHERKKWKTTWDTREKQYVDSDGARQVHAGGLFFPLFVLFWSFWAAVLGCLGW